MRERKTVDRWDIETNYGDGWFVETSEYSWKEAKKTYQEYIDNPYGERIGIRLKKRREKKESGEHDGV